MPTAAAKQQLRSRSTVCTKGENRVFTISRRPSANCHLFAESSPCLHANCVCVYYVCLCVRACVCVCVHACVPVHVSVCVSVCVNEREIQRQTDRQTDRQRWATFGRPVETITFQVLLTSVFAAYAFAHLN